MDKEEGNKILESILNLIYCEHPDFNLVEQLLSIEDVAQEFYNWLGRGREYCLKIATEVFNDNDKIIERFDHVIENYKLKIRAYLDASYMHSVFTEGGSRLDLHLTTNQIIKDIERLSGEYSIILDIQTTSI